MPALIWVCCADICPLPQVRGAVTTDGHRLPVDDSPQYTTLRDYLNLLRARRVFVVVPIIVIAALAYVLSARQPNEYVATATLVFQDESQALNLVGAPAATSLTPSQRASQAADTLIAPALVQRVRSDLGANMSVDLLTSALKATPKADTSLVALEARDGDARFAALLANTAARDAAQTQTNDARRGYQNAADRLRRVFAGQKGSKDATTQAVFADRVSQLLSLASVAQPVQVASLANVPGSPVSPKPVRNALVGAFIGLLLGLLAAFVRNSLDQRFRTSSDVEREIDDPIVGHVRESAMGYAGVATVGRPQFEPVDVEGFRKLRNNLDFLRLGGPPQCVAVTSGLPEEGKSTVAASLASAIAAADRSVVLVECDLRRPSLSARLGLEGDAGLTDYLSGDMSLADVTRTVETSDDNGAQTACNFACVPAGRLRNDMGESLSTERFQKFLEEARETYDAVIIDTAPVLAIADTLEVLNQADAVLLCVRSSRTKREQARAARRVVARIPDMLVGVVITGVEDRAANQYGYYLYSYGSKV